MLWKKESSTIQEKKAVVQQMLTNMNMAERIRDIHISEVDSPWKEKVLEIRRGEVSDIRLTLWNDNDTFLKGRIYRLLLYVSDVLDRDFAFNSENIPHGTAESKIRETYNHIWGIYVDSRVERKGIENFFDKTLRKNLFIDSQKDLPWTISKTLFNQLWSREAYTHLEIVNCARGFEQMADQDRDLHHNAFEIEINRTIMDHTAIKHVDRIVSRKLRDIAYNILNFTASHCKGTFVESSYYGIYFMYEQEIFAEMATTGADSLLITIFDFQSNHRHTYALNDASSPDIETILSAIKTTYERIANHSTLRIIKNPYAEPLEK